MAVQFEVHVAAIEDKIVQAAVVALLTPIYEAEFLGFSYGFRPGRSQHDALDALAYGIKARKVNWILDADVRSFFDHACRYPLQQPIGFGNWRFWISPAQR
jgi:retron-type reverse transcriptase